MSTDSQLILYHYNASPFAQRVVYYLTLRGIPYAECIQPMVMPRPDLGSNLSVSYRRIPLLAAGSSVYADTRLILSTLEALHPASSTPNAILQPLPDTAEARAITKYLSSTIIAGEIFGRAAQLIPLSSPIWSNPTFLKDRTQLSGRDWNKENHGRAQPESLVVIRKFFADLENGLLADGRTWLLNTDGPTMADIEAVWIPIWMRGMKDPLLENALGEKVFPKMHAYVQRFLKLVGDAKKKNGKPERLDGIAAAKKVLAGKGDFNRSIDESDPLGLKAEQEVSVWPIDSGSSHKDQGKLIKLTENEVAIEKNVEGKAGTGTISVHFPRTGFRISPAGKAKL